MRSVAGDLCVGSSVRQPVKLIVTLDLEFAPDHEASAQREVLERLHLDLERLRLPVTIFTTADAARVFRLPLAKLRDAGHEIGCHGRHHRFPGDDFSRMSEAEAALALQQAGDGIQRALDVRPRCFRGPWWTTSAATQSALIALGYRADFSVCPQRLDFFRTRGGTARWLTAPRGAYHPAPHSPFRRGSSPLLEVPLSCLGVPFIAGIAHLAGLGAGLALLRALQIEARLTGRPIVYLFHSYELCPRASAIADRRPWLQRLYATDPEQRYQRNLALLEAMRAAQGVEPLTGSAFVARSAG